MNNKGSHIINRIWRIARWMVLALYLFIVLGMVNARKESLPCRAIETHVLDSLSVHFVTGREITDMLLTRYGKILGSPIDRVNTGKIEDLTESNPFVAHAEGYKDIDGILHLAVIQRHPVARIIRRNAPDAYLDKDGILLETTGKNKPVYTLIISGNTNLEGNMMNKSVSELPVTNPIRTLYPITLFIDSSAFWKDQIEQIYIDRHNELWMAPRVGAHRILFGDAAHFRWKFRKLFLLYTYGLNNIGWNQYEEINLKYSNQIVCVKRK
jgi:cell division protein FtsQ